MKKTQTLKQQQQKTNHHGFLVMKTIVIILCIYFFNIIQHKCRNMLYPIPTTLDYTIVQYMKYILFSSDWIMENLCTFRLRF